MEIKGIILDYGGTIDTPGIHWSTVIRQAWEKAGVASNEALFHEAYVYAEQQLERTQRILPHHDFSDLMLIKAQIQLEFLAENGHFPPAQIEAKAQEIAQYCLEVAKNNTLKNLPVLKQLSEKYPMVIVSNFYGNLKTVLNQFGLISFFKDVIDSAEVKIRKPDTGIFELAIKKLGYKPEEILVIGDSLKNDILPAQKLGCQTLLIGNPGHDQQNILSEEDIKAIEALDRIFTALETI